VVASRIGGIQDTVEDRKTGLLFEPENTDDLADKIVTLLKDERLREDMGKAAKVKAKEYDWSKIAERTLEIYKKVITDFHEQKAK
jgi:glycosyltransferase involved in cell wall biosynthesis